MEFSGSPLSDADVNHVVNKAIGHNKTWKVLKVVDRRASDKLEGFLSDHRRMTISVDVNGKVQHINLFLKLIPYDKNKAEFINEGQFFSRESLSLNLIDKIAKPDPYPWCTTAYLKNDKVIAMPDLALEGYKNRNVKDLDDLPHALLTAVALARFHAAFANYETARKENVPFIKEYGEQLEETLFFDSPLSRNGVLLHKNFLKIFSTKYNNLDFDLLPLYLEAFDSVKYYDNTLNTLIHRDLWSNNIMFKYKNGVPVNALLVDFQIVRYAPPAFDPMLLLYMSTGKEFREQNEETILKKYYDAFMENVDEDTKKRLSVLKYDWSSFREWCEKARLFAMVGAMMICPFGWIDSNDAETVFNNEETSGKILQGDRTAPVVESAKKNKVYKEKLLSIYEEFIDRFVVSR